jgi:hypothetical protein
MVTASRPMAFEKKQEISVTEDILHGHLWAWWKEKSVRAKTDCSRFSQRGKKKLSD